jgi:hypothetical protein
VVVAASAAAAFCFRDDGASACIAIMVCASSAASSSIRELQQALVHDGHHGFHEEAVTKSVVVVVFVRSKGGTKRRRSGFVTNIVIVRPQASTDVTDGSTWFPVSIIIRRVTANASDDLLSYKGLYSSVHPIVEGNHNGIRANGTPNCTTHFDWLFWKQGWQSVEILVDNLSNGRCELCVRVIPFV